MAKAEKQKVEKKESKKFTINWKGIESFIALIILAGLAFKGVQALLTEAPEAIQMGVAVLVIILLVKSALSK